MNGQRWINIKPERIPTLCKLVGPVTVYALGQYVANILVSKEQKRLIDEVGFEYD